nr:centrosomal protein POC5-like; partial [Biomphalaria glabrata]
MSQENFNKSGNHSSRNSPPHLPPESPGSSVSSFLQNEYAELLKYAVGLPGADLASRAFDMPEQTKVFQPIVISRSQSSSARQTPLYGNDGVESNNMNTNSVYPTLLSNDEELGSQCEDDDMNFNKGKKVKAKTATTTKCTISDPAVQQMSGKLDGWLGKLKCDILEELCCSINTASASACMLYQKEKQDLCSEKERLQKEVNRVSEMLCTMEKSLARKDTVIENLTGALAKEKEKLHLAKAFYSCKEKALDKKREHFTEKIATNFHDNQLTRKVLKCWFGTIQQRWKERTEKICESKAQNICSGIVGDYEEKIKCLNQHISCLEDKIQTLQCEQEQYSQQVKKAFMRGVCALNMEAMSAFGTEDTCTKGNINMSHNVNANANQNQDFLQSYKHDGSLKSLPVDLSNVPVSDLASRQAQSLPVFASSYEQKAQTSGPKVKLLTAASMPRPTSQGATLAPPMASVVVERHDPITKQTIGKATAVRYPKKTGKEDKPQRVYSSGVVPKSHPLTMFKPLAGQMPPTMTSIKIVD